MIEYDPEEVGKAQYIQIYIEDLTNNMNEPVESFYITETVKTDTRIYCCERSNG